MPFRHVENPTSRRIAHKSVDIILKAGTPDPEYEMHVMITCENHIPLPIDLINIIIEYTLC